MTVSGAERFNEGCTCRSVRRGELDSAIAREIGDSELWGRLKEARPNLFSDVALFIPHEDAERIAAAVRAITSVFTLRPYREAVLSWAPETAILDNGPIGAFMGYDFHLGPDAPKLIEINTNAGGAYLNHLLAEAAAQCCSPDWPGNAQRVSHFEDSVVGMFRSEWQRQRADGLPRRVAIVDDDPTGQYLYPEFPLARSLFQRHGVEAVIADPSQLSYDGASLTAGGLTIDLVYNRLVDFSLSDERHRPLLAAHLDGAVVVTPNPHVHALAADKRNLSLLSDTGTLRQWGLDQPAAASLEQVVPRTVVVSPDNSDVLWAERASWFFKPATGYASKAAYRGDKVTRRVWEQITGGGLVYVAQKLMPPASRAVPLDEGSTRLKADVRAYAYGPDVLLLAARLYQGQTTNFRTLGGGFAPVFEV